MRQAAADFSCTARTGVLVCCIQAVPMPVSQPPPRQGPESTLMRYGKRRAELGKSTINRALVVCLRHIQSLCSELEREGLGSGVGPPRQDRGVQRWIRI